ncbi:MULTISPECIES: dihydrofolate reductase family protein [Streptomyces]|uniref:Dihydrofolate reductase family protein n=2 Tax=Streptomyces TaxID=1883 RepID=A0ABY9J5R9_9ACTN|nr:MULTISPECIES: dihydrofolate reductase family protein [unclassified Streptomyces]WSQ76637.1 dihydrofolate reductase family protein [Streptomyces sp. NBC_01213]TXS18742.1 dihydrofolate reductase [Streptomyces sp. wa22]WLQ63126.1 dihydrofolate reductase family protein [Streptomyces sp. Alt3]WSQ83965.1 dihydrofolate reductase family protein [Streptomyces sp. NBC_01212]WSR10083.1 dihydrofolate reductase family protein [Streptomyces sp. NBC_01208]
MAKLTLTTFVSLDGVMQGPGGPDEDTTGGFEYGGWTVPFADEGMGAFVSEVFDRSGAYLLGRRTYDIFSSYWPLVTDPQDPIAARLNTLPKHVVSRTLTDPEWENTTVVAGDVPAEVARLKERTAEGELQIHGSGTLAQSLLAHDLIDEVNLIVHPVYLGGGRRLFADGGQPTAFELTGARTTGSGIAIHTYRPAGRARFGTFEPQG